MVKENKMVQTEIGLISEHWILETFGDCLEGFSSGMTPYRGRKEYYRGDFPWITSGELNYNVINDTIEKITQKAIRDTNLKIVPKGTFLMAITGLEAEGTRGSCAITGINATTNQSCMALYPQKKKITTAFLYHYYVAFGDELALKYCQGTKQQSYNAVTAKKLPIFYPKSLTEQEAIASALSDTDAWIERLEQLIAKKRLIKQGAMQELLSPKDDWDLIDLGGNFSLKARIGWQGLTTAEYQKSGDYCLVTGTDFKNGFIDWDSCVFVEKVRFDQDRNIQLREKDVLVTKDGTIGKVAYIDLLPKPTTLNSGVFVIRPKSNFNNQFLYYILMSSHFDDFLDKITAGSTITHLYQKDFIHFKFYSPRFLTEQTRIANILFDMDAELEALATQLQKAKKIKQGMMQELLTGRIRLV